MKHLCAAIVLLAVAGCAQPPASPDLLANYAARADRDMGLRNPVITIPGTLGSRLVERESGAVIWGGESALSLDPTDAGAIERIALPIGAPDTPLSALRDGVGTDGVVRTAFASLLGATLSLDIYGGIIRTLIAGGYDFRATRAEEIAERLRNLDAFEFPYDWRRDIVEAAQDLDYFITRKRAQVAAERLRVFGSNPEAQAPVRFDIVAHSMGALVARYYLMYGAQDLPADGSLPELTWAGARNVDVAVLIAPPNLGAALSFDNLVNGKRFGPFQPFYPAALLGLHVSTYQLLPRARHGRIRLEPSGEPIDPLDIDAWRRFGWGLAGVGADPVLAEILPEEPDPERRRALADAHLQKLLERARRFQAAIDRPARWPEDRLDVYVVVGGGYPTPAGVAVDAATGAARIDRLEEGDGVVLRASALGDESAGRDKSVMRGPARPVSGERATLLLPSEHVELTQNPVFGDNLLFWLLESDRLASKDGGEATAQAR